VAKKKRKGEKKGGKKKTVGGLNMVLDARERAEREGWEAPVPFYIDAYYNSTLAELFRLLEWAGALEMSDKKWERREAHKVAWALKNALRNLKQDEGTISAAENFGPKGSHGTVDRLMFVVMYCSAERRAGMALGSVGVKTQLRAPRLIGVMNRLEVAMTRLGVSPVARAGERGEDIIYVPPVAREGERVVRERAWRTRAARAENSETGIRLSGSEGEQEGRATKERASPDAARARVARESDGWDG
jgi:hypothetical protein